jgi:hypothetical protein
MNAMPCVRIILITNIAASSNVGVKHNVKHNKLIPPDGRNRPGGHNRPGGYMTTVSVIGINDGWWDELEHYASMRQCLPNGKMTPPRGKGAIQFA